MPTTEGYTVACPFCFKHTGFTDDRPDGIIECLHCNHEIEIEENLIVTVDLLARCIAEHDMNYKGTSTWRCECGYETNSTPDFRNHVEKACVNLEKKAVSDSLDTLAAQLDQATTICHEAMTKLVDLYSSPKVSDDVKRSLKYICELQLGEVVRTTSFWSRELPLLKKD